MRKLWRLVVIGLLCHLAVAAEGSPPATQPLPQRPTLLVPRAAMAPRLDASLGDPAWESAAKIESLSLCPGPNSAGQTATPTQVRVLWDQSFLYVRFICQDEEIYAPHGKEHEAAHWEGDVVEVFVDPVGDGREFAEIEVNPMGGTYEAVHLVTTQPVSGADGALTDEIIARNLWDGPDEDLSKGLRVAAAPLDAEGRKGWIADLALPAKPLLRRLAMQKFAAITLRANFVRYDRNKPTGQAEHDRMIAMNWSAVPWGRPHQSPAALGTLVLTGR